jgi:hypothetical protein
VLIGILMMPKKYNILLIGNGKWGKQYINTIKQLPINLTIATYDYKLNNIDGVIICTPPQSHIEIAEYFLSKNIPVMIEKPLSLSLNEANKLKQYLTPILVNNIHLFSNEYQNLKNKISDIKGIFSIGCNNGPIRNYSSLWDYAPHDLSMILDLTKQNPHKIEYREFKPGLHIIKLYFDKFYSYSIVGNGAKIKKRELIVYSDNIYRYTNSENILFNAINVFLNIINGKKDYRMGLGLSLDILDILVKCH